MASNMNWNACVKWLIDCEVLPEILKKKFENNELNFDEFACALRDGVILCNLLNYLQPNSINPSLIHKQKNLGTTLSHENIQIFLRTCKQNFNINESDLFHPDMLYDFEQIEQVFKSLSVLSKCDAAAERCNGGLDLNIDVNNNYETNLYSNLTNNYVDTSNYISFDFYFDENINIYDKIMDVSNEPHNSLGALDLGPKPRNSDYVIREILLTENKYIKLMQEFNNKFMTPLASILRPDDQKLIGMNFSFLITFHSSFLSSLVENCHLNESRTRNVCNVFNEVKREFMTNYVDYLLNLSKAIERSIYLMNENVAFKRQIEISSREATYSGMKISDYLTLPFQRVSKYHLLLESLWKKYEGSQDNKSFIKKTWINFQEVGMYLNEIKRDQESILNIEKVTRCLNVDLPFNKSFKDFGRLIKEDKIRIRLKKMNDNARTRTVLLFETCMIILKKNIFGSYSHFASLCIYDMVINDPFSTNTKSINLLEIIDSNNSYEYEFYFKDFNQKSVWVETLKLVKPVDALLKKGNHVFSLSNFGRDIEKCYYCNEYISGIFFQGFKCTYCPVKTHKKCLSKFEEKCQHGVNRQNIRFPTLPLPLGPRENSNLARNSDRNSSLSSSNTNNIHQNQIQAFFCKSIYQYNKNPKPPFKDILTFEANDLIYLIDSDDDSWWKGYKLDFKCSMLSPNQEFFKVEGYFPRSHVKPISSDEFKFDIKNYSCYLVAESKQAEIILNRIHSQETMFMVRFNEAKLRYAITFKYQNSPNHILIKSKLINMNVLRKFDFNSPIYGNCSYYQYHNYQNVIIDRPSNNTSTFYSLDGTFRKCFLSLTELVAYYIINSIVDSFPEFDITLGKPYRDLIPTPRYKAIALANYIPDLYSSNQPLELKIFKKYFIISENNNGIDYWAFDEDGLIGNAPITYFQIQ